MDAEPKGASSNSENAQVLDEIDRRFGCQAVFQIVFLHDGEDFLEPRLGSRFVLLGAFARHLHQTADICHESISFVYRGAAR